MADSADVALAKVKKKLTGTGIARAIKNGRLLIHNRVTAFTGKVKSVNLYSAARPVIFYRALVCMHLV